MTMFSHAFSKIGLLLAILAAALMTACGGGGDYANNPTPLELSLSESRIAYGPITATIYGGRPPFYFETNSSGVEFPKKSNSRTVEGFVWPALEDGVGMVSVWDDVRGHAGRVTRTFESPAATYEPSILTVTATNNTGCTAGQGGIYTQICAGSPGIAELQLNGLGGVIDNEPVQFNVVQGNYQIRADSGSAPGTSVFTRTDSAGKAEVAIQTTPGSPTHIATIGAKAYGLSLNTSFTIVGSNFTILPETIAWDSQTATCPAKTASFAIYGGTPPYTMHTSSGTVSPSTVSVSGGAVVLTLAECVTGATLTARDANGLLATASISYAASSGGGGTTPPPPVVSSPLTPPSWGTSTARVACDATTVFGFTVSGGTPPYSVTALPMGGLATASLMGTTLGQVTFSAAVTANSNFSVYVVDSEGKVSTTTPVIYCRP
jgi:hypothetical protein